MNFGIQNHLGMRVGLAIAFGLALRLSATGAVNERNAEIFSRVSMAFQAADFFKPAGTNESDPVVKFAPMVLQERLRRPVNFGVAAPGQSVQGERRNGEPSREPAGRGATQAKPVVYGGAEYVRMAGEARVRLTYIWFSAAALGGTAAQGIRVTLDQSGAPVIWEALQDHTGARLVFVSKRLEIAARAKFGEPLPGRRYAIERALDETPDVVVARVLEDGPVPMGPMVYVGQTGDVMTVICRCMPAQAKELGKTVGYQLLPLAEAGRGFPAEGAEKWLRF